jgi:hypothetical protein
MGAAGRGRIEEGYSVHANAPAVVDVFARAARAVAMHA